MITLSSTPAYLTFLANHEKFTFSVNSAISEGAVSRYRIKVDDSFPANKQVIFSIDGRDIYFTKDSSSTSSDPYKFANQADLLAKLQSCYYFDGVLSFSSSNGYIIAQGVQPALLDLQCSSNLTYTIGTNPLSFEVLSAGSDPERYPNYSVVCRIETDGNTSLPWLHCQPNGSTLQVDPYILMSLISPSSPSAIPLLNPVDYNGVLKYRLAFAESYGSIPTIQQVQHSPWLYAINGQSTSASVTTPDWADARPSTPIVHSSARPFVLGEDNGLHLDIHRNADAFLYLGMFCNGSSAPASHTVTLSVVRCDTAAEPIAQTDVTLTIGNNNIYALPVSPAVLSIPDDCHCYGIRLSDSNGDIFTRTYSITNPLYKPHRFLLRNRYGVLQPFAIRYIDSSIDLQADLVVGASGQKYDITSRTEKYEAETYPLSKRDANRFAASFGYDGNYIYRDDLHAWQPITLGPFSSNVWTESEDFIRITFPFSTFKATFSNLSAPLYSTPALGLTCFVLTEDGYRLTMEDGTPLVWRTINS